MAESSHAVALRLLRRSDERLPWEDEEIERLDERIRRRVGEYWQGRAGAELRVAAAFSNLGEKLRETGAEQQVLELLEASIENENYHAMLCEKLATRYLGAPPPRAEAGPVRLPPLPTVDRPMRTALYAAGLCAVNESVAVVWLEHCFSRSTAPLARAVNRVHLSDEIVHARIGWAHLASSWVTPEMRRHVSRWLVPLLNTNVTQWLESATLQGIGVPEHGIPDPAEQRNHVLGAVRDVVIPGFDHVGVDVSAAARWFKERFE
jgi:hypothetical protein